MATPNQVSQWETGQNVNAVQMNEFSQDLYARLTSLTENQVNVSGIILNLTSISQSGTDINIGTGAFRFPDSNTGILLYQTGIFGNADAQSISVSGNGFIVARYVIEPTTSGYFNYIFPTTYMFVTAINPTTDCLICTITDGLISSYGNYLINTASSNAVALAGTDSSTAITPATLAYVIDNGLGNIAYLDAPSQIFTGLNFFDSDSGGLLVKSGTTSYKVASYNAGILFKAPLTNGQSYNITLSDSNKQFYCNEATATLTFDSTTATFPVGWQTTVVGGNGTLTVITKDNRGPVIGTVTLSGTAMHVISWDNAGWYVDGALLPLAVNPPSINYATLGAGIISTGTDAGGTYYMFAQGLKLYANSGVVSNLSNPINYDDNTWSIQGYIANVNGQKYLNLSGNVVITFNNVLNASATISLTTFGITNSGQPTTFGTASSIDQVTGGNKTGFGGNALTNPIINLLSIIGVTSTALAATETVNFSFSIIIKVN